MAVSQVQPQNFSVQNSQANQERKGNYTQVSNEMLEYLSSSRDLTATECRVCFYLIRELVGWNYEFKAIEIEAFAIGTRMNDKQVVKALTSLVKKGVLLKHKVVGYRTPFYGFNPHFMGRLVIGDPKPTFVDGLNVIDLKTFKLRKVSMLTLSKCHPEHLESSNADTEDPSKPAPTADLEAPKYPSNTLKYDLREETIEFLKEVEERKRGRWETVIRKALAEFPNDERAILEAIRTVLFNKEDLYGRPIKKSALGLFESTDWGTMRVALKARWDQAEVDRMKAEHLDENQRRLRATRQEGLEKLDSVVDIDSLKPEFRSYAMKGGKK
jgi:phage replication O-like protein O